MQSISKLVITKPLLGMTNAILLALSLCASFAWADNLESLRASGAIGESYTGYVFARDPAVRAEADAINAKRKTIYQEKAAAQGISIDQVGKSVCGRNIQESTHRDLDSNQWTMDKK
jgi:uncharacterized protein YdbL (DUF1318 family)